MDAECRCRKRVETFTKVAVLMGGTSSERTISLTSGMAATGALREAGYDVTPFTLERDELPDLAGITAAFIALHGRFGEDGGVQRLLEGRGIPYTGSGVEASELSFDKIRTQQRLLAVGIPVPKHRILSFGKDAEVVSGQWAVGSGQWAVVKAPCEGSSVGVVLAKTETELAAAIAECRRYSPDRLLVEQYIPGREWSVGVLGDTALPPVEIRPKDGWYGWDAKYFSGGTTVYAFPDDNPADAALSQQCRDIALATFHALGCRGYARVDFRIDPAGNPYVLELNALPGLTASSILPRAAARIGLDFPRLCATILDGARTDHRM